MPPIPAAICGTRGATRKKRVATAIPNWPVALSRAMIDQVIYVLSSHPSRLFEHDLFGKPVPTFPDHALPSGRIALHAAGIGGGAPPAADLRGRGQAALRPVRADLQDMTPALQFFAI